MVRYAVYTVTVVRTTAHAMLLAFEDGREEWIPYSACDPDADITMDSVVGDEGEVGLPEWLSNARGL